MQSSFTSLLFVLLFYIVNTASQGELCGWLHWCIDGSECKLGKCYSKEDWDKVRDKIQGCGLLNICADGSQCKGKKCIAKGEQDTHKEDFVIKEVAQFPKKNNNLKQKPSQDNVIGPMNDNVADNATEPIEEVPFDYEGEDEEQKKYNEENKVVLEARNHTAPNPILKSNNTEDTIEQGMMTESLNDTIKDIVPPTQLIQGQEYEDDKPSKEEKRRIVKKKSLLKVIS